MKTDVEPDGGKAMDFYTMVLRKSGNDWVALCLENGLVGQGMTKDESIKKLKEAIESFEDVRKTEEDVYGAPISIKELHEFLGLRIPVATVVGMIADRMTEEEILKAYSDLEREDIQEALRYAAEAVRERELPLVAG
jgi:uncharacterized protein (DUF433 family)